MVRFNQSDQLTLGQLIDLLEPLAEKYKGSYVKIMFDFGNLFPGYFTTLPGKGFALVLNFHDTYLNADQRPFELGDFVKMLKLTIGEEFTNWKGCVYYPHGGTLIWVARPGHPGETAIVGVIDEEQRILLETGYIQ